MKHMNQKLRYILFIASYIVLNIFNTYFVTSKVLNRYIEPFKHIFKGEVNQLIGNFIVLFAIYVIISLITRKAKKRMITLIYVTFFLNFVIYALGAFNLFYGTAFSRDAIVLFKNPADGFAFSVVLELLLELVTYYRIVVFLPTMILIFFYIKLLKHHVCELKFTFSIKRSLTYVLSLFAIAFFTLNNYYNLYQEATPVESMTSTYAIQNLGVYPYYVGQLFGVEFDINYEELLDIKDDEDLLSLFNMYNKNQESYVNFFDGETYSNHLTLDQAVDGLYIDPELSTSNDLTGILKDKNLVLIHLESFNQFLIDQPDIGDTMPFLQALFEESFVFNNFYNNVGMGVSSDGELSVLTGLNPTGDETLYWEYNDMNYELTSLVDYFNQETYYTEAIHGDKAVFYNRDVVYPEMYGFDQYYAVENFIEDGYVIEDGYLFDQENNLVHHSPWISDFHLADFTYETGTNLINQSTPFMLFPITMMGHTPYDYDPYGSLREDLYPEFVDLIHKITLRYINYSEYYNDIVKRFFIGDGGVDQTLDDTVYVFYSDHGSGIKNGDLSILLDKNINPLEERQILQQITSFIYVPSNDTYVTHGDYTFRKGLITGEQNLVRSEIDLYRTLIELFDLPAENDIYFGTHGMSKEPTFALDNRLTDVVLDHYFYSMRNPERIFPEHFVVDQSTYDYIYRYKVLSDYLLSEATLQKKLNLLLK